MNKKEMICIVCPIGCHLEVIEDETKESGYRVEGADCKRGKLYGVKELTDPTRLLTSTVKVVGGELTRLPVRTKTEIPKDKLLECMEAINKIEVKAPIHMGDVLLENILDTGVDIIATRDLS